MSRTISRIAITNGGGDAPGLNAVIHSVVIAARRLGWEVLGIRDSYEGLLSPHDYADHGIVKLRRGTVRGITSLGGTILGTTNRGNPFRRPEMQPDGSVREVDRSDDVVRRLAELGVDALIAVGGDGSLAIADALARKGVRVVGVPKTIDNDLEATVQTFGFDSAVSFATECLDRLRTTAASHRRLLVVEVMGRHAGWIALHSGIAGQADVVLIPEIPFDLKKVAHHLARRPRGAGRHAIVVVGEGATARGGAVTVKSHAQGQEEKLGGVGEIVARELERLTGRESRSVVLGHLLRGGSPTATDRLLGVMFGAAAVRALEQGLDGVMVSLRPPAIEHVPLADAIAKRRTVQLDGDAILVARALDICLGD